MASKWVQLASLWRGKKKGVLTGTLGGKYGAKLVMLPNDKTDKSETYPDFSLFAVPFEPDNDSGDQPVDDDDDVPF
jgi:hypothetical protein